MAKRENVLIPVADGAGGEPGGEAIQALRARLAEAGSDVHDSDRGCSAFESEDSGKDG